ncbi:MAG: IS630 family transposase [Acidobacteria bacterium]|nr:IS630 family transposase [Acidobacteriota bacterium]
MRADCLQPNGENASAAELLVAMEAAPNKRSYRRLAAIRALLMGLERAQVAALFGRSERLVRLWILAFNGGGIDALASKPRPGRPRKVKFARLRDLLVPVLEDPAQAGQLHWTGVKLHGWLKAQLCQELGYRTVIRYLHQLDYNLRVPQPWPERQNEAERAAFLEQLHQLRQNPRVELWYADECGVEGDPRPRRRWTARGSRPRVPYLGDHIRANVVGAVCPATGQSFAMIFNAMDTDCFQCFLDQLAETVPRVPEKRRVLIVDNASWHKAQRLQWHHFESRYLPTYSPDFNPIERLWLRLKADYFSDFIARTPEQLSERLLHALKAFIDDPPTVAAQCATRK